MNLLKRAETEEVTPKTRRTLTSIDRFCVSGQMYAQKRRHFKSKSQDDKDFDSTIYVDIFYIDGKLILHLVD